MAASGFSGRTFKVLLDDDDSGVNPPTVIAAITTKSKSLAREPIDVTTDDSSGWRELLAEPGGRSVDVSIEGVATTANWQLIQDEWMDATLSTIEIEDSTGHVMRAADGFCLTSVEFSGEQAGNVAFTGELQSSGEITITPPA